MVKQKYVVAFNPDLELIGTVVELDPTEARELVREGRLRPYDKAEDGVKDEPKPDARAKPAKPEAP